MKTRLGVVIIAKNEEKLIAAAIKSVRFASEVVVIDTGSIDRTINIAEELGARVVKKPAKDLAFAQWRTMAIKEVESDWILYLDADERITPELGREIGQIIKRAESGQLDFSGAEGTTAYAIPRENYYLGQRVRYGGSWPDYVKRLFYKQALKKWTGRLHEEPVFKGKMGHLENPMRHYTHRDITSMVEKTTKWSVLEAEELFNNYPGGHPPMTWWRFFRIMLTEFWNRGIKKQGLRDGTTGVVEVIFQMFSRFITYARLWEMQVEKQKAQKLKEK